MHVDPLPMRDGRDMAWEWTAYVVKAFGDARRMISKYRSTLLFYSNIILLNRHFGTMRHI